MFYGWRIVGVAALAQAVSVGSTFYCYGAFLKPLAAEFGVSRLAVTLGLTLLILVQGAVGPFLGRAIDRGSVRSVMLAGVLLEALGLALLSFATEFWQLGLIFATAISVGSFWFGPLATATLVANWFVHRRGRALGIAALGGSFGGVVFPPLAASLIEGLGWRGAALAIAAGILLLLLPFAAVLVRRPEDLGSRPDGEPAAGHAGLAPASEVAPELTNRALLRDRNFWAICAGVGFVWCPVNALLAHLVPYATDLGLSAARASVVMSSYALGGGIGRLLFGFLADRIEKRTALWIAIGGFAAAWIQLLGEPGFGMLLAAGSAAGVAVGGIMPLWGALTGASFGRAAFGRAMGLMNLLMLPFTLAGAPVAAYLFDRSGSYQLAFTGFLAFFALGSLALLGLRLPALEPGAALREA